MDDPKFVNLILSQLRAKAPTIGWDVTLLNQNIVSISASKAYLSVRYTLPTAKLMADLAAIVKQLAWLMNSVTPKT